MPFTFFKPSNGANRSRRKKSTGGGIVFGVLLTILGIFMLIEGYAWGWALIAGGVVVLAFSIFMLIVFVRTAVATMKKLEKD
ncbi:MAG: hypothetical protein LBV22_00400 [Mycoplasmataceae bacterium]|nr:hypothetical protein [Mycoplasmataceae bacterium]